MGRLFGTDGIRGIAGEQLTAMMALRLGIALSQVLRDKKIARPRVLIGKDPRVSGDLFEASIASGLMAGGSDAQIIGVTTTPAIAYLIRELKAEAGVMISASHNAPPYNGLKVFGSDGYKISDEDEERIERIILEEEAAQTLSHPMIGRLIDGREENRRYEAHVRAILADNAPSGAALPRRILFDLSHGSACATARAIFTASAMYGFEADFRADTADGYAINERCGSTHLSVLARAVVEGGYDMGFAFDGDADRCLAVDEKGTVIDGDMLIAALAADRKQRGHDGDGLAVVTVMTNLAFHLFCRERGIAVATTDVGDRYVLREMLRLGAGIGGEQSGHIILPEYATTGDGQVTAAVALGLLARSGSLPASEVFGVMRPLPQVTVNVTVPQEAKKRVLAHPDLKALSDLVTERLNGKGRVLIRASGTESLIRIMLEGERQEEIERYAEELSETVKRICGVQ